jgi:quercetin dioxygenase-like cupin family protein
LRELARRIAVSPSLVSQIELGRVRPSVPTLYALVDGLGITLDRLRGDGATPAGPVADGQPDATASPAAAVNRALRAADAPVVQRHGGRPTMELAPGVHWERLTPFSLPGMEFVHTVYEPGSESSPEGMYRRHSGHEWGYIISGTFNVSVGFDEYVLEPGDSISFSSNVHHRLHNEGTEPVHAIWSVLGGEGDLAQQSPLLRAVAGGQPASVTQPAPERGPARHRTNQ